VKPTNKVFVVKKLHIKISFEKFINEDQESLLISFFDISEFDVELGEQLLAYPEDVMKIMEQTLKQFYEEEDSKFLRVRLTTLPATEKIMIRDIRAEHLNKLMIIEGLVRRKTDVRPKLKFLEYLCTNPSCSFSEDKLKISQNDEKPRTIKACPKCKSGVELVHKELVDSQNLVLEEIPEHLDNSADQPKRVNVLLQDDLVSPFKDGRTNPGSRVYVIGMVREIPMKTRTGSDSTNYDLLVEGNYIDLTEDDYSEITISKEEEKQIKELAEKDDINDILVANTAPSIYGYNRIKEAVLLQLFGGSGGVKGDGIKTRGDIHILIIGDPGAAKSQLLKSSVKVAPEPPNN
jgi:replicative DNA helicase Mcm